jgi:hypothetical protein
MIQEKDINYWKNNCEENYITTPISVLRYISELEKLVTPHQQETYLKQIDQTNPVTKGSTALVQEISDEVEEAEKGFIKLLNGKSLPTKELTEVAEHYFIVGYQEGYNKAKENLYTEEQLKIVYTRGYDRGIDRKPRNMEAYIEFIKQNKKD